VLIKAHVSWVRMNKHLNVLVYTEYMESPNLVASCVAELDDTLPPYGCYMGYCQATHGVFAKAYAWRMALG
jgi:hypothetical protein